MLSGGSMSRTVERHIAELKTKGIITREGSKKAGYWMINSINKEDSDSL